MQLKFDLNGVSRVSTGRSYETVQMMNDMKKFYQEQSVITDPEEWSRLLEPLPDSIEQLCQIVQGVALDVQYANKYGLKLAHNRKDENLSYVSRMLERVMEYHPEPLCEGRKADLRLMVTTRDIAVLLCSILRHKRIPARVLCGFSAYQSDFYPSHWLCEYWDEKRNAWALADASLDPLLVEELGIDFSICNVPQDQFYRSEVVWTKCRNNVWDEEKFGRGSEAGLSLIRSNLLRNLASLNRYEVGAMDNLWGVRGKKELRKEELDRLQLIGLAIEGAEKTFDELRSLFENDIALSAPVRTKLDMAGSKGSMDSSWNDAIPKVVFESNAHSVRPLCFLNRKSEQPLTDRIKVEGARHHNLKNVSIEIPKNKMIVFTGVSGSGKSSLLFDTIYAEAQRRFIVGLSPHLRRFLEKAERPKVDFIYGLSPAIAIEQKSLSNNPRSTVGTVTEISGYMRLLFSKIGQPECLKCGTLIRPQSARDIAISIADYIPAHTEIRLFAPLLLDFSGDVHYIIQDARKKGATQLRINGEVISIDKVIPRTNQGWMIEAIGDSFTIPVRDNPMCNEAFIDELTESIKKLLEKGRYTLNVETEKQSYRFTTSLICPCCHSSFPELTVQHFSINNPLGMCPECNGVGSEQVIDPARLLGDPNLSILDGALAWFGNLRDGKRSTWPLGSLDVIFDHYGLDIETPWKDLPEAFQHVIYYGSGEEKISLPSPSGKKNNLKSVKGLVPELTRLYYETGSDATKKKYGAFMKSKTCTACRGTRLCPEARTVKLCGKTIAEASSASISEALEWIQSVYRYLDESLLAIGEELIIEIYNRLSFLIDVGLHYLTLNRTAPTLSGGEGQRVRLASQLSSGMVDVLYVLDEPSIGLHPRDIQSLLQTLFKLRDQGNSVLVVEHKEQIIRHADHLIDIGPKAGVLGGRVMAQGTPQEVMNCSESLTGQFLKGQLTVQAPKKRASRKTPKDWLILKGATNNNLKNVTAKFPIGCFTCVTGVSGSGKSSLIGETLEPLLVQKLNNSEAVPGAYEEITGLEFLDKVIKVSQDPIGRTPRSNPATYTDLFNKIRKVFASTEQAKAAGLTYESFSFNSPNGRCETCQGQGHVKIEMQFLADVWIPCQDCEGKRFKPEILSVTYDGKNISDVLDMDVNEATQLFDKFKDIKRILNTFQKVGLEYIKLGQSATTLSGGEAQRVKLVKELSKAQKGRMIYILDEPTTGLHFNDIQHLLNILHRLVDEGHTVIVIEHDLDVIKTADWTIELGPDGGTTGGEIIAQCTPAQLTQVECSYTGQALKQLMKV